MLSALQCRLDAVCAWVQSIALAHTATTLYSTQLKCIKYKNAFLKGETYVDIFIFNIPGYRYIETFNVYEVIARHYLK